MPYFQKNSPSTKGAAALLGGALLVPLVTVALATGASATTTPTSSTALEASASTGPNTVASCHKGATEITFWDWIPSEAPVVEDFNRTHPSICVNLQDVGGGLTEYDKVLLAIRSHSGLPNVAETEYDVVPEFQATGALVNLSQYPSVTKLKSDYYPWIWKLVSPDGGVYAVPGDIGPLGMLVNTQFMAKYHLTVPTTWAQLATEALEVHKANPHAYLTDFPTSAGGALYVSLLWQAGVDPFAYKGSHVTYNFDTPGAKNVATYWQNLIKANAVALAPNQSPAEDKLFSNGDLGIYIGAAWSIHYFSGTTAGSTNGHWRVYPLPTWSGGKSVSADWGGSAYPVFKEAGHVQQTLTFLHWFLGSTKAWDTQVVSPIYAMPPMPSVLQSPLLSATTVPLTGPQHYYPVFAKVAASISPTFSYDPFQVYERTTMDTELGKVAQHTITVQQAMQATQATMIAYARKEGFSASS